MEVYTEEYMEEHIDNNLLLPLIKKQVLFAQLADEEINELAALFSKINITAHTIIVKEGDWVDSVFLIQDGQAKVECQTIENGKVILKSVATLSSGDAIGLNETGFYSISGKRTATVTATTDMILYKLSVAAFHGFALSHTHVGQIMNMNIIS